MELTLIRHALPERIENEPGTPADPPLAPLGRRQAVALADWLAETRFDAMYASPLKRARETAAPLAARLGMQPVLEPRVSEFDAESNVYVPLEELKRTNYAAWKAMVDGGLYAAIDLDTFLKGVRESIEEIIARHRGQSVAIVCHGGVINAWAASVLGIDMPLFFEPAYTSLHRFVAARTGERMVVSLNETAHLRILDP